MGHLHAARVLARIGFDWLTIDMEHSPYDWREVATVVASVADAGCVPLIRVPEGSHTMIKRALDAGAFGVVVPMVETVEQAEIAIHAAKYPPEGNRSAGGGMHNLNFNCSTDEYFQGANNQILVVLQTESPKGIENANAIYRLPGCDAIFVGPNDLRFQMRKADGTFPTDEQHEAQIQRVIGIGRETGRATGIHVQTAAEATLRIEQGMQFIAIASDLAMLYKQAQSVASALGLSDDANIAKY